MGRLLGDRLAVQQWEGEEEIPLQRQSKEEKRQYLVDLARHVEEEMIWKAQLEDREDCQDLVRTAEAFERTTRKVKTDRMRFAFQLRNGMELVDYENEVAKRQAHEKEKAVKLQVDTEMRVTEITCRGLKRKAFRKEKAK